MNIGNMRPRFWILPGLAALGLLAVVLFYSTSSMAAPDVTWTPSSITQEIARGQSQVVSVTFSASENVKNLNVRVVPALQSMVQVSPLTFPNIQKGKSVKVTITLAAPPTTPIGTTAGTIELLDGNATVAKPLPVSVIYRGGLPPDPGEAGKATVAGIDSNGNGVRDDVERWIGFNYPNSEKTRATLLQMAQAYQYTLTTVHDTPSASAAFDKNAYATRCVNYVVGVDQMNVLGKQLLAQMLNTPSRIAMNRAYLSLLPAFQPYRPPVGKAACIGFDPDTIGT